MAMRNRRIDRLRLNQMDIFYDSGGVPWCLVVLMHVNIGMFMHHGAGIHDLDRMMGGTDNGVFAAAEHGHSGNGRGGE